MIKSICIFVLVVCVGVMIYSIINAINVNKRNKATDEATRKMFLAKLQKEKGIDNIDEHAKPQPSYTKQPLKLESKELDYDTYNNEVNPEDANGKTLKDFFKAD